jgi:hypothetical protein
VVGSDSAIDARSPQDVYSRKLEKSVTVYHVPQFLKLTWVYDLPIGRGRVLDL